MSESTTEQSSREQEREALRDARYFVELYARRNPRFEHDGEMQDPSGVNACLERIDAVLARPTVLLQDENSGREGRRYNEWHASRPDARLNAREAAASIPPTAITAEEAGREGEAKDAWISDALRDAFGMASHHMTAVAQEYASAAYEQQRPSDIFHPAISKDGDQWCALYGDNLQDGVCGFGDTPDAAMLPSAPAQSGGQGNG